AFPSASGTSSCSRSRCGRSVEIVPVDYVGAGETVRRAFSTALVGKEQRKDLSHRYMRAMRSVRFAHGAGLMEQSSDQVDRYTAVRQYSLAQILAVWAAAAVPMAFSLGSALPCPETNWGAMCLWGA